MQCLPLLSQGQQEKVYNENTNTKIPMKLLSAQLGHSTVTTNIDRYSKPKIEKSIKYLEKVQK